MGREKVLFTMSFPGVLFPLSYAIYFHNYYIREISDKDIIYNSFIYSFKITFPLFLFLLILLYFYSKIIACPILYLFFSFMGFLVNLFNSSILLIILEKLIKLEHKTLFYYGFGILMNIYGHIRAERICFDR